MRCKVVLFVAYGLENLKRKLQPVIVCENNLYLPADNKFEGLTVDKPEVEIEIEEIPRNWAILKEATFEAVLKEDGLLYLKADNGKEIPVAVSDKTADVIEFLGGKINAQVYKAEKKRLVLIPLGSKKIFHN